MDEADFLAAVIAVPDDDAARLAYADWLEERGDERGEFIRAQCERAAIGESRFESLEAGQRWRALAQRERELLSARGAEWAGPVAEIAAEYRFHRGFIEEAVLSIDRLLTESKRLFSLAPIRRLEVTGALAPKAKRWKSIDGLEKLSRLSFRNNADFNSFSATLAALPSLKQLQELTVAGAYVNVAALRALAFSTNFTRLTRLTLHENSLDDESLKAVALAKNWTNLRALSISRNRFVTIDGVGAIATSPFLTRLESLEIREARAGNGAAAFLAFSPNLRTLNSLHLAGSLDGGAEAAAPLADSTHLPNLRSLSLEGNNLHDAGVAALARSPHFPALRFLDLAGNEITSAGAAKLAAWPRLSQIAVLDLRANALDAAGAAKLAASPNLAPHAVIRIGKNRISADEGKQLDLRYPGRFAHQAGREET